MQKKLSADQWLRLELRTVGNILTVTADGQELGRVTDESVTQPGGVMLYATKAGYFRDIVYVPLDKSDRAAPTSVLNFSGHRYQLVLGDSLKWSEAKTKAEAMGGHLAVVETRAELDWLVAQYTPGIENGHGFWLGGQARNAAEGWQWFSGKSIDRSLWIPGQPAVGQGGIEEYPAGATLNKFGSGAGLDDSSANKNKTAGFLVEWDDAGTAKPGTEVWQDARPLLNIPNVTSTASGGLIIPRQGQWTPGGGPQGDVAIRIRAAFKPELRDLKLILRRSGGAHYQANLFADGTTAQIQHYANGQYFNNLADKRSDKPSLALHAGDPVEFEFRVVGQKLSARVNGQVVAEGEDSALSAGALGINWGAKEGALTLGAVEYLDLSAPASAAARPLTPATATKDNPFVNLLGMKFVPVPGTKVLFGIWDTRVQDYAEFAKAQEAAGKQVDGSWKTQTYGGVSIAREPEHPVVGVSWEDAQAFCQWLTATETAAGKLPPGQRYRLPTDEEWSTAAGLPPEQGATPGDKHGRNDVDFPWGQEWPPTKKVGNYADETFHAKFPLNESTPLDWLKNKWLEGYVDGFATTSPVGSFPANVHGLYDMGGNVWQWCEDPWQGANQVLRGGSWSNYDRRAIRSSYRIGNVRDNRDNNRGFRCVLAPAVEAQAAPASLRAVMPATATKDAPFVNTLGMKFVPVPITGGPTDTRRVLFSVWETRVQDYEVFAKEAKREWPKPKFEQGPTHPAVLVNWEDAQTFCSWLAERERKLAVRSVLWIGRPSGGVRSFRPQVRAGGR